MAAKTKKHKSNQSQFSGESETHYTNLIMYCSLCKLCAKLWTTTGADRNGIHLIPSPQRPMGSRTKNNQTSYVIASANRFEIVQSNVLTTRPKWLSLDKNSSRWGSVTRHRTRSFNKSITRDVRIKTAYTRQDGGITKDNSGIKATHPFGAKRTVEFTLVNLWPTARRVGWCILGTGVRICRKNCNWTQRNQHGTSFTLSGSSPLVRLSHVTPQWKGAAFKIAVSNVLDETVLQLLWRI